MFGLPPPTASKPRARLDIARSNFLLLLLLLVFCTLPHSCSGSFANSFTQWISTLGKAPDYSSQEDGLECGRSPSTRVEQRIIGGRDVGFLKYPWYVALTAPQLPTPFVNCGGTLISRSHVLTAAHCYRSSNVPLTRKYRLVYKLVDRCGDGGSSGDFKGPQARAVNVHPQYTPGIEKNDIALITLEWAVRITPACLPQPGSTVSGEGVVIGFGVLETNSNVTPCQIQEAFLPMFTHEQCIANSQLPKKKMANLPKTICAGGTGGGQDACRGDSGGPLLSQDKQKRYVIRGITSFGYGCGVKNFPGVYTNVAMYIGWIESVKRGRRGQRDTGRNHLCNVFHSSNWLYNLIC